MFFTFSIDQRDALKELHKANLSKWAIFVLMSAMNIKNFEKLPNVMLSYALGELEDNVDDKTLSDDDLIHIYLAIPRKKIVSLIEEQKKGKMIHITNRQKKLNKKQIALVTKTWKEYKKDQDKWKKASKNIKLYEYIKISTEEGVQEYFKKIRGSYEKVLNSSISENGKRNIIDAMEIINLGESSVQNKFLMASIAELKFLEKQKTVEAILKAIPKKRRKELQEVKEKNIKKSRKLINSYLSSASSKVKKALTILKELYLLTVADKRIIMATIPELHIDLSVSEKDFINKIIDLDVALELTSKKYEDKFDTVLAAISQEKIDYYMNTPPGDIFPGLTEGDDNFYFLKLLLRYKMKIWDSEKKKKMKRIIKRIIPGQYGSSDKYFKKYIKYKNKYIQLQYKNKYIQLHKFLKELPIRQYKNDVMKIKNLKF